MQDDGVVVKCCTSVIAEPPRMPAITAEKNIRLNMSNYLLSGKEMRMSADCHVLHYAEFPNPQIPSQVAGINRTQGLTRPALPP